MRIDEILRVKRPCFSFEFFPPKSDEGVTALLDTAATLRALSPSFVSVTYGAGGGTRARTLEIVKTLKTDLGIEGVAHITSIGATVEQVRSLLTDVEAAGVENILALRGDPRPGEVASNNGDGFEHAADLIRFARKDFDFCVGAACHPEKHLEAPDAVTDIRHLSDKVDAGAQFLISQLFFDNDIFLSFVGRARRAGIDVPIIPGIMPITNFEQIQRFTSMCGATIPERLLHRLSEFRDEPEAIIQFGVAYATLQCVDLIARGVNAIHFYTLNKSPATRAVVSALYAAAPWESSVGRRYVQGGDALVEAALSTADLN
ncbi:MAG TPA: methylenetetrahydrofolate reductase [NAD(P)H] [Candidatus Binatus sp.]|nr:methylenetetrahydrofolate reductase [NAD(P)H] [Candidatus Binatus sp.]